MQITGGAGNHLLYLSAGAVLDDQGGRDADFDRFAHGHHHGVHVEHASGTQGFLVGAIHHSGLNGRVDLAQLIDGPLAGIDGQHLRSGLGQFAADRRAEASYADHGESTPRGPFGGVPLPPTGHRFMPQM